METIKHKFFNIKDKYDLDNFKFLSHIKTLQIKHLEFSNHLLDNTIKPITYRLNIDRTQKAIDIYL